MAIGNKFIIDTNILFSALYSPDSVAGKIIDLALEKKIELFAPEEVKAELTRNLKKKLGYSEKELDFTLKTLPVNWLNTNLYANFLEQAKKTISLKDVPILAAHYLTKFPIITDDQEFFTLNGVKTRSLRDVVKLFDQSI